MSNLDCSTWASVVPPAANSSKRPSTTFAETSTDLGSQLIIRHGASADVIPQIVEQYGVRTVHYHSEIHSEEQSIVDAVKLKCKKRWKQGFARYVEFKEEWGGNTLYTPEQLPWHNRWGQMPDAFRPWRRGTVEARLNVLQPHEPLKESLCKPHPFFANIGSISTLKQLGCDTDTFVPDRRTAFPYKGGEGAAMERVNRYIWGQRKENQKWDRGAIVSYHKTRHKSIGTEYSTKWSPFLAHGCISPRWIFHVIRHFEARTGIKNRNTDFSVIVMMVFRDWMKFESLKWGDRIFYEGGPWNGSKYEPFNTVEWKKKGWCRDLTLFQIRQILSDMLDDRPVMVERKPFKPFKLLNQPVRVDRRPIR